MKLILDSICNDDVGLPPSQELITIDNNNNIFYKNENNVEQITPDEAISMVLNSIHVGLNNTSTNTLVFLAYLHNIK